MKHCFDTILAKVLGVNTAIIFDYIGYCIKNNKINDKHFRDGKYWFRYSFENFCSMYDYMKPEEIRNSLDDLKNRGLILVKEIIVTDDEKITMYAFSDNGQELYNLVNEH